MASWTDKSSPQFNPYIQQLPVEAMVKVGMQKQALYDKGVEKIQTAIDTVAGMDVARDIDKTYLQSKINELGNNLKNVAAGDFSNFQLVNSVAGMTKQISNDKNVLNAVSSTKKYRKELEIMEKARSEGKSAIANEWDFSNGASEWLNSNDLSAGFNKKYTQYIDVKSKWMDVFKELHPNLREEDIAYVKNEDGSLNYNKTAAAMQKVSKKTVSSAQIQNALKASLTPEELNQLSIDGRFQFRGYDTPEKLSVYAETKYNSQINRNKKTIKELQGVKGLSSSNPVLREKAEESIKGLLENNTALSEQRESQIDLIYNNPEQAKATIYKNEAITQFAGAFAWEENKTNLMTNPVREDEWKAKNYALKYAAEQRAQREEARKLLENKDKTEPEDSKWGAAGTKSTLGAPTKQKDAYATLRSDNKKLEEQATAASNKVYQGLAKKGVSVTQIDNAIEKYKSKDEDWYKLGGEGVIPIEWRGEVQKIIELETETKRNSLVLESIDKEVDSNAEVLELTNSLGEKIKDLPDIVLRDDNYNDVVVTQDDILNLLKKQFTYKVPVMVPTPLGIMMPTGVMNPFKETAYSGELTDKEKLFLKSASFKLSDPTPRPVTSVINKYLNIGSDLLSKIDDKREEIREQISNKKLSQYLPATTSVVIPSKDGGEARQRWEGVANSALAIFDNPFEESKGATELMSTDDIAEAKTWINSEGKGNVSYAVAREGMNSYLVLNKEGKSIPILLTDEIASQLPSEYTGSSNESRNILTVQSANEGSTAPSDEFEDAYFKRWNMPNVSKDINLAANLIQNKSNSAIQYINYKLVLPEHGVVDLVLENELDLPGATSVIKRSTGRAILYQYLKNPLISTDIKQSILKEFNGDSKNPLFSDKELMDVMPQSTPLN